MAGYEAHGNDGLGGMDGLNKQVRWERIGADAFKHVDDCWQ